MNAELLLQHFKRLSEAPDAIPRLRRFILDLAMRGKLVEQDPNDEPAVELLKRIAEEKARLVKAGEIRRDELPSEIDRDVFPMKTPIGWVLARLATISLRIHYGFTASADAALKDVRMLRITDIQDNAVNWHTVPGCAIDIKNVDQYKLKKGDILIARTGGTIGKTFLVRDVPVTAVFASYLIRIQGTRHVFDEFLKLFLESSHYWTQLRDGTRGTGQPNVNGQTLGKLILPLPPLAEQHRIVSKVDELMALCDQLEAAKAEREQNRNRLATASLHRLNQPADNEEDFRKDIRFTFNNLPSITTRRAHIKQLRQTILNLAVRGKLVPQNPNDEPASELLERISEVTGKSSHLRNSHSTHMPFELPEGWEWSQLGLITTKTGSGSTPRGGKTVYQTNGVLFLRSQNIYNDGLRLNDVAYINDITNEKMSGTIVESGDLLLNITGGSIGRCCLIPGTPINANISQHVAIIRLAVAGMRNFAHKVVQSPFFQSFVIGEQTGAGRGGLPKNRMDKIPVPIPPLAEQRRIVAKVVELMVLCDQLETQLTTTEADSRRLLEAVLHEALAPALEEAA